MSCLPSLLVKAPIFVARQLVKHKFLRWNEISRRYVDDEPEFYKPEVWRGRSADKKQGSEGVVDISKVDCEGEIREIGLCYSKLSTALDLLELDTLSAYDALILAGVAPEQARMVLPTSQMTEFYWSGSLDAFASMCKLRLKEDTQYESRLVAQQIDKEMLKLFPVSWEALIKGETTQ